MELLQSPRDCEHVHILQKTHLFAFAPVRVHISLFHYIVLSVAIRFFMDFFFLIASNVLPLISFYGIITIPPQVMSEWIHTV